MRIGIDGSCLSNRRGFGRFARESLKALAELESKHQLVVILDAPSAGSVDLPKCCEAVVVGVNEAPSAAASSRGRRRISDMLAMGKAASRASLDLLYFPASYRFFPVWNVPKVVVTMHDTLAFQHPDLIFPDGRGKLAWTIKEHLAVLWSNRILTVSEASRTDILDWFRLPPERVVAVTEGPDRHFRPAEPNAETWNSLERYGIPRNSRYLLYVGGLSPHKNLLSLIKAFALAKLGEVKLAIVGDIGDVFHTHIPELRAAVARENAEQSVIFTGFVPDSELAAFYQNAIALVQPSLAEGFGLPPMEAMACGTPVLASKIPALLEVIADGGIFFNPREVKEMSATLKRMVDDHPLRAKLAARALARSAEFTWEKAARLMMAAFEDVAAKGGEIQHGR